VEGGDVVSAISILRLLLGQTHGSILERSEHGCWNRVVVHKSGSCATDTGSQEVSSLDSDRGQLKTSVKDVTDSVNVLDIGLLLLVDFEFSIAFCNNTSICQVESSSDSISAHSEQNSVESVRLLAFAILPGHCDRPTFLSTSQALWGGALDELSVVGSHVLTDQVGHVLVKASEQD